MPKPKVQIIYQDNEILVINKLSGVSVTADRSGALQLSNTLSEQLNTQLSENLRLIHRLDKQTSGVLVLAKTKQAQTKFSHLFEKRLIKKTYLALVTGSISEKQGIINKPLMRDPKNPDLMQIARKKAKDAITKWELLADFGIIKLLAVFPLTGRTHQIRVHLPSLGLPLAIDPMYGSSKPIFLSQVKPEYYLAKGKEEKPLIDRLTLHAYQLELPVDSHQPNCFIAPLDKKFAATIKMLTKHNPNGLDSFTNPDNLSKIINTEKLMF